LVTSTPVLLMMSPQSPGRLALVNRSAPAPLQHAAAVELVVDEVLVVEDVELVDVDDVDEVDVEEVELVDDVDVELVDVDEVEVLDVDDVDVLEVELVDVEEVDVVVVPATGQPLGAGASFLLRSPVWFFTSVPPNSAQ
jgi:hypothetical protein